jgi:hypothetical protein
MVHHFIVFFDGLKYHSQIPLNSLSFTDLCGLEYEWKIAVVYFVYRKQHDIFFKLSGDIKLWEKAELSRDTCYNTGWWRNVFIIFLFYYVFLFVYCPFSLDAVKVVIKMNVMSYIF